MSDSQEEAEIIVKGRSFKDWETVFVQQRIHEPFHWFRFTAAERDPIPDTWDKLQIKEGDSCEVFLAGHQVIRGIIVTRQVAYDAHNHGVMLIGKSDTFWPSKSSVDTPGGNYDGLSFVETAKKVLKVYGHEPEVIGKIDDTKLETLQNEPGEIVWDFLERIARQRGVIMGSTKDGKYLLVGEHDLPTGADLVEGFNIKRAQVIKTIDPLFEVYDMRNQSKGDDGQNGADASEQKVEKKGSIKIKSKLITISEQPSKSLYELAMRLENEVKWHEQAVIEALITVQGWLRAGGDVWHCGEKVMVKSPMAMLNQYLGIISATFTQDSRTGTQTTLELVKPELMNSIPMDVRPPS